MTLTSAGDVGIGTASPVSKLSIYNNVSARYHQQFSITRPSTTTGALFMGTKGATNDAAIASNNSNLCFGYDVSDTFNEAMRITTGGNVLIGTTTVDGTPGISIDPNATYGTTIYSNSPYNGTRNAQYWAYNGSVVGYIQTSTSSTSYVTSSDYRLKEDIAPMTGALVKVSALKPCTYKWKLDGSDGQGFIAHELQEIVPDCVTGEKDAVDEDGKPQYQGIDTSFLVATLVAAIQELKAEVDALKAGK